MSASLFRFCADGVSHRCDMTRIVACVLLTFVVPITKFSGTTMSVDTKINSPAPIKSLNIRRKSHKVNEVVLLILKYWNQLKYWIKTKKRICASMFLHIFAHKCSLHLSIFYKRHYTVSKFVIVGWTLPAQNYFLRCLPKTATASAKSLEPPPKCCFWSITRVLKISSKMFSDTSRRDKYLQRYNCSWKWTWFKRINIECRIIW